jgi:hypothetical protein
MIMCNTLDRMENMWQETAERIDKSENMARELLAASSDDNSEYSSDDDSNEVLDEQQDTN